MADSDYQTEVVLFQSQVCLNCFAGGSDFIIEPYIRKRMWRGESVTLKNVVLVKCGQCGNVIFKDAKLLKEKLAKEGKNESR